MPSYTRGRKKDQTSFVLVTPSLLYGFTTFDLAGLSGVTSGDLSGNLGHLTAAQAAANAAIKVMGANSPKPPRVSKRLLNATVSQPSTVSTFCAYNRLTNARSNDWKLSSRPRGVRTTPPGGNRKQITAIAELSNGAQYAWSLNQADFNLYAQALGLANASQLSQQERDRLIMGSTTPKPGMAELKLPDGKSFSSFVSTSALQTAQAAGFAIISPEVL